MPIFPNFFWISKVHFWLPAKSKHATCALPETTHTSLPSVTGVGDDMFCFILISLPRSYCFRQSSCPVARERQSNNISWPPGPFAPGRGAGRFLPAFVGAAGSGTADASSLDGELRKILSPHTIGV